MKTKKTKYPQVFVLSQTWWEEYEPILLFAPNPLVTKEQFEKHAHEALQIAARELARIESKKPEATSFINVSDIVRRAAKVLQRKRFGYTSPARVEVVAWGGIIYEEADHPDSQADFLDAEVRALISQHNRRVDKWLHEDRGTNQEEAT